MYVSQSLDYETNKEYILSIMATDGGDPPLSNTAVVHVNITDANDNSPVFASQTYDVSVRENAPIETELVQVNILIFPFLLNYLTYRKVSNIRHTKCQNLNDSRLVLQLSVPNPLKPSVKSIMKM